MEAEMEQSVMPNTRTGWWKPAACALFAVSLGLFVASAVLNILLYRRVAGIGDHALAIDAKARVLQDLALGAGLVTFALVGLLIAWHQPRNRMGWLFLACFGFTAAYQVSNALSWRVEIRSEFPGDELLAHSSPPAAVAPSWLAPHLDALGTFTVTLAAAAFILVALWFPTGRLLSPRWRWGMTLLLGVTAIFVVHGPWSSNLWRLPDFAWVLVILLVPAGAIASILIRYHRARNVERLQLKWAAYGVAMVVLVVVMVGALSPWLKPPIGNCIMIVSLAFFPLGAGVGIMRYHLYDIDLVISRTLLVVGLVLFVVALFVTVAFGLGWLVGDSHQPGLAPSVVAAGSVAVAFQSAQPRVRRWVARVVYGRRATAHEVLSTFSARLGDSSPPQQQIDLLTRLLADATGAKLVRTWLRRDDRLVAAASSPPATPGTPGMASVASLAVQEERAPDFFGVDVAIPIVHDGELLGAVTLTKPRGNPVTNGDRNVTRDLANQAGLVMRNMRLTDELERRIEDLRASRQRLLTAQDDARRALERDLHDGAQHRLLSVKLKVGLARTLLGNEDVASTAKVLDDLAADTDQVIETVRALAHGVYPPLLKSEGVVDAFLAEVAGAPAQISVESATFGRHPDSIEATIYFCLLEATQNALRHARAAHVKVVLQSEMGAVGFTVSDDGCGFDSLTLQGAGMRNMADRVEALGGTLRIASSSAYGTEVTGSLPLRSEHPVETNASC
jgi:signal transduction histidine kinase